MLARTLFTTAFLTLAVALDAYAPSRDGGAHARDGSQGDAKRHDAGATRDRPRDFANARVTADATLYHAPNQAIGMLRAGARVRVNRLDGAWAHVVFTNNQIAVQGWVARRALAALTDGDRANTQKDRDRVKGREERERKRNEDRARKGEHLRNRAKDR